MFGGFGCARSYEHCNAARFGGGFIGPGGERAVANHDDGEQAQRVHIAHNAAHNAAPRRSPSMTAE